MNPPKFELTIPAESCTADSMLLMWSKSIHAEQVAVYKIIVNGKPEGTSTSTAYVLTGLQPRTSYTVIVIEILHNGCGFSTAPVTATTQDAGPIIHVEAFGAKGDGQTLNTRSLQSAIDSCPPGGTVWVPEGCFRTGALFLKSSMTLHLDEKAILLGSDNVADYPVIPGHFEGREEPIYASLINCTPSRSGYVNGAERLHDIRITGRGLLHANGKALFSQELQEHAGSRGRAVYIANTDRVHVQGITLRESPAWCLHLVYCNHVTINDIQVHTKYTEDGSIIGIYNGDGIDPDSCLDVNIVRCMIASQDDCIALKSGRDAQGRAVGKPTARVRITNCSFHSGFGVALGSEMSGGIHDVLVQDCSFWNVYSVGSIKAPRGRGNVVDRVLFDNLTLVNHSREHSDCKWFRGGINVDMFYSVDEVDYHTRCPRNEGTPTFSRITFQNITLETVAGNAIFIAGLPESPVYDLTLRNIRARGKYGMQVHNVNGLQLEDVSVEIIPDEASATPK